MIGRGASPSFSGADNVVQLLAALNNPKEVTKRLSELQAATHRYEKARDEANAAVAHAEKATTALTKREKDLAAREERLKTDTDAHNRNREQAEALHEDRAASLAERAAVLDKERKEHSEKVNEFSRYREREIAAIQAKAVQANKVMESANAELKGVEHQKAVLEAKLANIENWKAHIGESLKGL